MTGPVRVAYALGANLGDRAATLASAVRALTATPGLRIVAVSPVYETEPVGGPRDQPSYLNAVVVADSARSATELLARAHEVEQEHGRVRAERWGPRTLDVDLLAAGEQELATDELTLPHPRAHLRAFVLVPWADVDPTFQVPGLGRVADLLAALTPADRAAVRPAAVGVTAQVTVQVTGPAEVRE